MVSIKGVYLMPQFKQQKEEKEVISLRLSTNMIKELDEKAAVYDMSRNEFIVQSIRFALDNINDCNGHIDS